MSLLSIALGVADDTDFDPNQVTPGVEGFIFTGLMAALIIGLGFLLVSRLRRNAYRHEVRDQIASELEEADTDSGTAADAGSEQRN